MHRQLFIILTCTIALLALLQPAAAQAAEPPSLLGSSLRMIWGLLVVLGLILIIYGFMKKRLSLLQGGGKGIIRIIETRHLMPKKSLYLVEVRGREYLLGSGGDSIQLIAELDPSTAGKSFHSALRSSTEQAVES